MNPNFVGCVENALGIRDWLESQGHQYIVTPDKEGPDSGKQNDEFSPQTYVICLVDTNLNSSEADT